MDNDLFSQVYKLNWGLTMANRNERNTQIGELLRQMDSDTLRAVDSRLRLHASLHKLIDTLLNTG